MQRIHRINHISESQSTESVQSLVNQSIRPTKIKTINHEFTQQTNSISQDTHKPKSKTLIQIQQAFHQPTQHSIGLWLSDSPICLSHAKHATHCIMQWNWMLHAKTMNSGMKNYHKRKPTINQSDKFTQQNTGNTHLCGAWLVSMSANNIAVLYDAWNKLPKIPTRTEHSNKHKWEVTETYFWQLQIIARALHT